MGGWYPGSGGAEALHPPRRATGADMPQVRVRRARKDYQVQLDVGESPFGTLDTLYWEPFQVTIVAGGTATFTANQPVSRWIVAVSPAPNNLVQVFVGPNIGGVSVAIGGGGSVKVPAMGYNAIALRNDGSATARVSAMALRNCNDLFINPGEIA